MSGGLQTPVFAWTDDNTAEAKRLRESGLSFTAIAIEIGCPSRCAVIGRLRRAGFVAPNTKRLDMSRPARKPKQINGRKGNLNNPTRILAKVNGHDPGFVDSSPVTDLAIPEAQRRQLLQLQHHHCRWPVGDPGTPGFFFCGAARDGEGPYCVHHARRAVQAA